MDGRAISKGGSYEVRVDRDWSCCTLEDGHAGPCMWICNECQGSGRCFACNGTGDDGSGLDYTCMECGGGECPYCDEGMRSDD